MSACRWEMILRGIRVVQDHSDKPHMYALFWRRDYSWKPSRRRYSTTTSWDRLLALSWPDQVQCLTHSVRVSSPGSRFQKRQNAVWTLQRK